MRIDRIELRLVRLPLVHFFETSFGRVHDKAFILVRLLAGGLEAWGECVAEETPYYSPETTETAWHVITGFLAPRLLALDVEHPRQVFPAFRAVRGHNMAKAALEMAAWDLQARAGGQPLSRLLGGQRARIASGVSVGIQDSFDDLAAKIRTELDAGYRRVKIKIKPGWDVEAVRMVRERFGAIPLMVDANAAYSLADADRLAALDAFDLMMIEQPLDYDDVSDHAQLQRRLKTPICLDESIHSPRVARDAIAAGACRIVNIKPGRVGGFAESIAVHDVCAAHGVPVWHGGMLESGIGRTHNIHLSTLPNFTLPGDVAASRRYFVPDLIDPPVEVAADGTIAVPTAPGIGVAVNVDRVERATFRFQAFARVVLFVCAALAAGCATAPVVPPPQPEAPVATYEQKLGWMLRLEDHRVLRDSGAPATVPAPAVNAAGVAARPVADLIALLSDADPRVRRRAALAIGRVGLKAGVRPLEAALAADREPEVRQMAAFSLGLLRDPSAAPALRSALGDEMPIVQGRAAEALGVLGDAASSQLIAGLVASIVGTGEVAAVAPDDVDETHAPVVEVFRLGVLALGRLKNYEALASAVLDQNSLPRVTWWPVAAAFQRVEDRRAAYVLTALTRGESRVGRAFAARGLGALKEPAAVETLVPLIKDWERDTRAAVAAARALGSIGDRKAGPVLIDLLRTKGLDPLLRLEVIAAIASVRATGAFDALLPLAQDPVPAVRAAVFAGLRAVDPFSYTVMLSGLDPDPDWRVRSAIASSLATLDRDAAEPRLMAMLKDPDLRVVPAVLSALVRINAERLAPVLLEWLAHPDVVIRSAAASGLGELKPAGGDRALVDAFHAAGRDDAYGARAAALDALAKYGPEVARPVLREALADKDWAVRVHAAALLAPIDPSADLATAIRPAPPGRERTFYDEPELIVPTVSPRVYIDTSRGRIEIELAVVDAPLTCLTFMTLARKGFYTGVRWHRVVPNFVVQAGDPRGDGEGGPGFTIRDEINQLPYRRGTLGLALEWADTGGSQFFLTHSPQPHLDGRYTVFGQVVRGLDVLDRLQLDDVIVRVLVWDGKTMAGVEK